MVGSQLVKVLSMKEPPGQTFAHILGDLLAVPGELIACFEWQRVGQDRMRREIQSRRRHFFNKRVSLVNYVTPAPEAKGEDILVDESATATVKQLGDALTEMEVNGHVFGRCSLTVVLHHEDRRALDHHVAQAMKVVAAHDGAFFDETYNLLNAWLSIVPGNGAHNLRRLALLDSQPDFRARPEWRRCAGRSRRGAPRRLGPAGATQCFQRAEVGTGRLALWLQRHPVELQCRSAGYAG